MRRRHSVRTYTDRSIEGEAFAVLQAEIAECNERGGLHMQLMLEELQVFGTGIFKYGQFKGVCATTSRDTQADAGPGIAKCHFELAVGRENFSWT